MNKYVNKIQDSVTAMRGLADAFNQINAMLAVDIPKKADKPGTLREKKKTQKGAIHKVNPTFTSLQKFSITPAEYRRRHMGQYRRKKAKHV